MGAQAMKHSYAFRKQAEFGTPGRGCGVPQPRISVRVARSTSPRRSASSAAGHPTQTNRSPQPTSLFGRGLRGSDEGAG
jgi:hypothetical protein